MAISANLPLQVRRRNIGFPSGGIPDQGWKLYITSLVMVLSAGLIVMGRCATRLASKKVGSDDYTIVASLVFSIWLSVMIQLAVVNGYGIHEADLDDGQRCSALKLFWIAQIPYKVVVCLNKVSVTLFSKRIFTTRRFQVASWCVLAVIVSWGLAALGATVFQCIPVEAAWDRDVDATCIDKDAFWTAYAIGNVITDAIVLILPLPMVFQLRLKFREKIMVSGIFLLGGFVLVCSIVRTTAVSNSLENQKDTTWNFIPRGIWTLIEANMGIICACLPLMKQMLRFFFPRMFPGPSEYYSFGVTRDEAQGAPSEVYPLEDDFDVQKQGSRSKSSQHRPKDSDKMSIIGRTSSWEQKSRQDDIGPRPSQTSLKISEAGTDKT